MIESKEQTVEKFYNEESVQEENNEEVALDNINTQAENNFSLNEKNYDKGLKYLTYVYLICLIGIPHKGDKRLMRTLMTVCNVLYVKLFG